VTIKARVKADIVEEWSGKQLQAFNRKPFGGGIS
jgi:hypothetical protein